MNQLNQAHSPYLRQRKDNLLNGIRGLKTLQKAKRENRRSALRWLFGLSLVSCDGTQFEDADTARLMNENFINIKLTARYQMLIIFINRPVPDGGAGRIVADYV